MPIRPLRFRRVRSIALTLLLGGVVIAVVAPSSAPLAAQGVETPVAFDQNGRLKEITPGLADRMGLRAPSWPVQGEYKRATVARLEGGGYVLIVQRPDGAFERTPLSADQFDAVRLEVSARVETLTRNNAMPTPRAETPTLATAVPTEANAAPVAATPPVATPRAPMPPRLVGAAIDPGSFVNTQAGIGAFVFAPLAWIAVDDKAFSPSASLLTIGVTYLAAVNAVNTDRFTAVQRDLGRDGALFGGLMGWALSHSTGTTSHRGKAWPALLGAVGGDVAGVMLGANATDAEASGARIGALAGGIAAATFVGGIGGLVQNGQLRRNAVALLALGATAGVPLGMAYVGHAPYTITRGDLASFATTATLGAIAGGAVASSRGARTGDRIALSLGVGAGLGAIAGDLAIARPFDLTVSQAGTVLGGAGAGATVAVLPYLLSGSRNTTTVLTSIAIGGVVGAWGGLVIARPSAGAQRVGMGVSGRDSGWSLSVDPMGALYAAAGMKGTFPIASLTF
jgi:hypothetical protein